MAQNDAIGQLNEGLKMFKKQTLSSLDTHAKVCIDVAIVTFNDNVDVIQIFAPVAQLDPDLDKKQINEYTNSKKEFADAGTNGSTNAVKANAVKNKAA